MVDSLLIKMLPAAFYGLSTQASAFNDPLGQTLAALAAANSTSVVGPTNGTHDSSNSTTPTGNHSFNLIFIVM